VRKNIGVSPQKFLPFLKCANNQVEVQKIMDNWALPDYLGYTRTPIRRNEFGSK
jgi:hypothetical protein